jgi:hypothetical protein
MKQLPLTQGKVALVDDDFFDYCLANGIRFYFSDQGVKYNHRGYAIHDGRMGHKIRMHHMVLEFNGCDVPSGMEPDHINGNTLDNRLENLQIITRAQNRLKKNRRYANKLGFIGVVVRPGTEQCPRYRAYVSHNGKTVWCGQFHTPEEAARKHDEKARELQGAFANLNFPS